MRSSNPKKTISGQRSNSQKGMRNQISYDEDHSYQEQENYPGSKNRNKNNLKEIIHSKVGKTHERRHRNTENEEVLSSLSGFTASDNEDHDDLKFKMSSKMKKAYQDHSDEEDLSEEHKDIVLNPTDDLKARFEELEMIKKMNEDERRKKEREREILGDKLIDNAQNIPFKRPHTSHAAFRGSENIQPRNFELQQKENIYPERPQTANVKVHNEEMERMSVTFKPIYTKSIQSTLIEKKKFNYNDKSFRTIRKKSDPVSRFSAFQNTWNKTKFLKSNPKGKEGRKLNLEQRNQVKPDFIFHRYQPKYVQDN